MSTTLLLSGWLAVASALLPPAAAYEVVAAGQATYYAEGVMEQVLVNRGLQCPDCAGYVALLDCTRIGSRVWLKHAERLVGPLLVADCAARAHRPALLKRQWAVDVDWQLAERLGMAQRRAPLPYVEILEPKDATTHDTPTRPAARPDEHAGGSTAADPAEPEQPEARDAAGLPGWPANLPRQPLHRSGGRFGGAASDGPG